MRPTQEPLVRSFLMELRDLELSRALIGSPSIFRWL